MRTKAHLHPFVSAYVNSCAGILALIKDFKGPETPVVRAYRAMTELAEHRISYEQAAARAHAASTTKGEDPNLVLLLFAHWSEMAVREKRIDEATALLRQAGLLVSKETSPEVRAALTTSEALLAGASGNHVASMGLRKAILETLPRKSVRYGSFMLNLATEMSAVGMGAEMEADLLGIVADAQSSLHPRVLLVRAINLLETVRLDEVPVLLAELAKCTSASSGSAREVEIGQQMLAAQTSWLQGRPRGPVADSDARPIDDSLRLVLQAGDLLVVREPQRALDLLRPTMSGGTGELVRGRGFFSFHLVRAELSAGHGEAARRVIALRREIGNRHYLDDFFLARIELLAGRREEAARFFAAALASCRRYRAERRLELELRLSIELSPADMLVLMSVTPGAGGEEASPVQSAVPAVPPPSGPEAAPIGAGSLIGRSAATQTVRRLVLQFAPLEAPVLITGETGTGKELVARALHEESVRRTGPFVAVNCGAISENLLESELFGHERGAFTGAERAHRGLFEEAGAGTIFLDEIGEMPLRLQVALLRVLETGEIRPVGSASSRQVNCRVVSATNADLADMTEKGTFRKDLLYRLRRLEISIPPLRERREDILPLADHFLRQGRSDGARPELSAGLKEQLQQRDWPGNVRELRNVIELMRLTNSESANYDETALEAVPPGRKEAAVPTGEAGSVGPFPAKTAAVEVASLGRTALRRRERLRDLFRQHRHLTRSEIARILGVVPMTATADLKELCREGFVEMVQPSASTRSRYFAIKDPPSAGSASSS